MKRAGGYSGQSLWFAIAIATIISCFCGVGVGRAQSAGEERSFPQSKAIVEKMLREMQAATAGRLPTVEGFAAAADHPLDRYQRGYYQSKFQVSSAPAGGSVVRVSVQVTAWYADPAAGHSGYQVLTSNGRLEADLLDQLAEQLGRVKQGEPRSGAAAEPTRAAKGSAAPGEPAISAPVPRIPQTAGGLSSSLAQGLAEQEKAAQTAPKKAADNDANGLKAEAESLEEVLKNQSHPKNLVAVKKSGTPVVGTASLTAKTLFLASAHDEFEMLDFNRDWVHVRISGLSRGWIWRNNLEMPDGIPDSDMPTPAANAPVAADLFHVTREEKAPFPGDWPPLRGKTVKIVSVEKINEAKESGPQLRLEFAKSLLEKDYAELAQKSQELAGIVLIFDSVDGGMIAATLPTLQEWKAGKLSDAALWHQCFFDPPETFTPVASAGSQ
ncbi:MAG TPA: hypothetical protein VFE08_01970 [Candidatus Sulfotelmatobacter sp.]|nr:hypothetical protein [Candidatus Sulfotelmatobacter sp.]